MIAARKKDENNRRLANNAKKTAAKVAALPQITGDNATDIVVAPVNNSIVEAHKPKKKLMRGRNGKDNAAPR